MVKKAVLTAIILLYTASIFPAPVPAASKTPAAKPASAATAAKIPAKRNMAGEYYKYAIMVQKKGDYMGALKYYGATLKYAPKAWQAWLGMGLCYYKLWKVNNARMCFKQVLILKPNEPTAKKYYAALQPGASRALKKQAKKPKTKGELAWRSALFPGFGQFYNDEPVKGYIYAIGFISSMGGILKFIMDQNDAVKKYENTNVDFDEKYQAAERAGYLVYIPITTAVLFWSLSIIDGYMTGKDPDELPRARVMLEPEGNYTVAMDLVRYNF